jgi:cystathionine gamma-synthase
MSTLTTETARATRNAYNVYGDRTKPTVLVLGGISATRHLLPAAGNPHAGWWPGIIGNGRALDVNTHCLIGVDYIGGRGDSEIACNDPVPRSTQDHARDILEVLDELDIERLDAIVGASFGGMVALALCEIAPERVRQAIIIAAAHCSDPMSAGLRSLQRRVVALGVSQNATSEALSIARGIAVTTYRTAREFRERFEGADAAGYLQHQGERFAASFTADGFVALSHALDSHRVDPSALRTPLTLIGFDSDSLVPPAQLQALHRATPSSTLVILPSRYGHDGFLKESAALNPIVRRALHQSISTHHSAATRAVRASVAADPQHGAVIPPLHLSTTFTFEEFGRPRTYDYTRSGNPTRDQLGDAIADMEGARKGIVTATGMSSVLLLLQLLGSGDLLLAPHDCYGGTHRLLNAFARKNAFQLDFVDFTTDDVCDVIRARRPRMVWLETPSNPLLRITDIALVSAAAREVGALTVADNTFLSPALQQPLSLGADVVVHSTTKYINGHSDVVGGAVVARDPAVHTELAWWSNCLGITGSPFDAWLTLRGLRTLHVRVRAQQSGAHEIAAALHDHPLVKAVHYPGLPTHDGHALALRQQSGPGAMLSFELKGGATAARAFVDGLSAFCLAESLGGVESLIAHPPTMTHASMSAEARATAGISDGLLRLSVGLESVEDLLADVYAGLERVEATCTRTSSTPYR